MSLRLTTLWRRIWKEKIATVETMQTAIATPDCWGRDDALDALLKTLHTTKRSSTLLYGDSGIGKTTLLVELTKRIRGIDNTSVGFFESPVAEPDPLLRTLDNLLSNIYTLQGSKDQIRIILSQIRELPTFSAVREFLHQVQLVALEWAGLGALAKTLLEIEDKLIDQVKRLDLKVPSEFRPKLGVDVFEEIVGILQKALPDRKLIFIVDNLSAGSEAAPLVDSFQVSLSTILSYLSLRFSHARNVHFVLSWKLAPATQASFELLRTQLVQYDVQFLHLSLIKDQNALTAWLTKLFSWFPNCTPNQVREILRLTRGLPQVVVRWKESDVSSCDIGLLDSLANDVMRRRYAALELELRNASEFDRRLLYILTLMQHPIDAASLGVFINQPSTQTIFEKLEDWVEKQVLRVLRPSSAAYVNIYDFEHEAKREIAQMALRESFADHAAGLDMDCYGVFTGLLGPPHELTPFSPYYLFDALALYERVKRPRDELTLLRSLFRMQIEGLPAVEFPSEAYLKNNCLLNLLGNYLALLFVSNSQTPDLTALLVRTVLTEIERQRQLIMPNVTLAISGALGVAVIYLLENQDLELSQLCLDAIVDLYRREFTEQTRLGSTVGVAMFKFMEYYAKKKRDKELLSGLVNRCRELYASSDHNEALGKYWALALSNLVIDASYDRNEQDANGFLGELRELCRRHPESVEVALELWEALGVAAGSYELHHGHRQVASDLMKEMQQLGRRFPGFEELALKRVERQKHQFQRMVDEWERKQRT
jgi:hypothetical protein